MKTIKIIITKISECNHL